MSLVGKVRTYRDLYELVRKEDGNDWRERCRRVEKKLLEEGAEYQKVKNALRTLEGKAKKYYQKNGVFAAVMDNWLNLPFVLEKVNRYPGPGRPVKEFNELNSRQKWAKMNELNSQELFQGAVYKLNKKGYRKAGTTVQNILKEPANEQSTSKSHNDDCAEVPVEVALRLLVGSDLSFRSYRDVRRVSLMGALPSYKNVTEMKAGLLPDGITSSADGASVPIINLVHQTFRRITEKVDIPDCVDDIEFAIKVGTDGSTGVNYKQSGGGPGESLSATVSVMVTTLVPLQLSGNGACLWVNPTPNSAHSCRPISITNQKETLQNTQRIINDLRNTIEEAGAISCGRFKVTIKMYVTMVDQKTCNLATNTTSSLRCFVCGGTRLTWDQGLPIQKGGLDYGIQPLHAKLLTLDFLLRVAYHIPFEKMTDLSPKEAELREERKRKIQTEIRRDLKILVDVVKTGSGTTNDGNTARKFFASCETVAKITEIDLTLLKNFANILRMVASSHPVQSAELQQLCDRAAEGLKRLYPWVRIPPTVHKLLCHATALVEHMPFPLGFLSEEPAEAVNKYVRRFFCSQARQIPRTMRNEDVLKRLLLRSDPILFSLASTSAAPPASAESEEEDCEDESELIFINNDDGAEYEEGDSFESSST